MAPLQGPALYEYNDGVFANSDWKGICHPSRSKKRKDVMKVGRFGIGFNSVYHLTGKALFKLPCTVDSTCDKLAYSEFRDFTNHYLCPCLNPYEN